MPEKRQKQSQVLKPHHSLLNAHELQPNWLMGSSGPYRRTSPDSVWKGLRSFASAAACRGHGSFSPGRPWRWSPEGPWAPGKGKPAPSQIQSLVTLFKEPLPNTNLPKGKLSEMLLFTHLFTFCLKLYLVTAKTSYSYMCPQKEIKNRSRI